MSAPKCQVVIKPPPGWPYQTDAGEMDGDRLDSLIEESKPSTDELEEEVLDALKEASEPD
jgi:hypothetical protein